jgi:hypothetical protein
MSNLWRRDLAWEREGETTVPDGGQVEKRRKEAWNIICLVDYAADMDEDIAASLYPDIQPGRLRVDGWYVERLQVKPNGTSRHYVATVELVARGKSGDRRDPNPLRRPIVWSMTTDYIEVPAEVDRDNKRIENKAFEPLIGIMTYEPVLMWSTTLYITKTPIWLVDFAEKCTNSTTFTMNGFEALPETLKMEGLEIGETDYTIVDGKEISFRPMPLKLAYRKKGWTEKKINQGMTEYIPPQNQIFATDLYQIPASRRPCVDSSGKPVTKPVPLTKEGRQFRERVNVGTRESPMYEDRIKEKLEVADINFIDVNLLKKLDFNLLLT